MNCNSCGANLPPGASVCPVCGAATPYNATGYGGSSPYDPTVQATPYGTPPRPSTTYGAPPYGSPPPPPQSANPYGGVSSPAQYPYGAPPVQQGDYGVQPPPPQPYIQPQPPNPPPRRRSRVGLIIGIVLLVVLLACIGVSIVVYEGAQHGVNNIISSVDKTATVIESTATASTNITPTTSNITATVGQGSAPSGLSIDPAAAAIITGAKMSNGVDSNFYPTSVTDTFTTQQTPDVVFNLSLTQTGYAEAKWYYNGQYQFKNAVLALDKTTYDHGYFPSPTQYHNAGTGTVELYWCTQSDCSDGKLAAFVNFTITSAGMHESGQPTTAFIAIKRPE